MGQPDPRIERWIAKDRPWRDELAALRAILLSEDLTEALKWRQPCYIAHGSNIALLVSLKDGVAVSFLKGVLLNDSEGRLEAPGPNSRSTRYMRFDGLDQVAADAGLLRDYLRRSVENAGAGKQVHLPMGDVEFPDELVEAMDTDAELARAFAGLTPGRQRGWALHFRGARTTETRRRRIEKARPAILKGKGMHDR